MMVFNLVLYILYTKYIMISRSIKMLNKIILNSKKEESRIFILNQNLILGVIEKIWETLELLTVFLSDNPVDKKKYDKKLMKIDP